MKARKIVIFLSLALILAAGLWSVVYAWKNIPVTYDGSSVNVLELYKNPENEDFSHADGVASVIVQENLSKTYAANDVASIVFDFRGYDTLGESFILLTAIAGSFVILSRNKKEKKKEEESHEV